MIYEPKDQKTVRVWCNFQQGPFPHERVFIIDDERSIADEMYCFTEGDTLLDEVKGTVPGFILGKLLGHVDGKARVYLPDGEIYLIDEKLLEV